MNIMKNYLLQHIRKLIFATGIVIICSIASMVPMLLTQKLIDVGFINKDFRYIVACSLYIGIITIVKSGLSYISLKQFSNVGHTIVADLRSDIFDKLLRFPIDYFTEKGSGYLLSRLNEVSQISSLFSPNNVKFLTGFIEAIFALVMIGRTNTNLLMPSTTQPSTSATGIPSLLNILPRNVLKESTTMLPYPMPRRNLCG